MHGRAVGAIARACMRRGGVRAVTPPTNRAPKLGPDPGGCTCSAVAALAVAAGVAEPHVARAGAGAARAARDVWLIDPFGTGLECMRLEPSRASGGLVAGWYRGHRGCSASQ